MASKPNPSWSQPQKDLHRIFQEAQEIIIPYSGPEIPVLDNHSNEAVLDDLGVVKALKKRVDAVEKTLVARFKARLGDLRELRSSKYEASIRTAPRVALDQGLCKELLIDRADRLGVDLNRLLDLYDDGGSLPKGVELAEGETNTQKFFSSTDVDTLTVKAL